MRLMGTLLFTALFLMVADSCLLDSMGTCTSSVCGPGGGDVDAGDSGTDAAEEG